MKWLVSALAPLVLAACVSVPRDAGLAEVQQAIAARTGQPFPTAAPLDGELTADQAVAIAVVNNPRLQITLEELGVARADLIEASTIANPFFELEVRFPSEPYRAYELRLAQSLIDLIQLPRRRALGRAAFDAAQLRVSGEVLRFAGDVRASYFDALAASRHVEQQRTIAEAAQAAAEVAIRQHAAGNITDLDLENEQALYEQTKLDFARAERESAVAREALARNLGVAREVTLPADFPPLPAKEFDQQQLEQLAAQQRLDVALARRELEIAQRQVPIARLAALGEVIADVHYQREPTGEHTVGPGIELPIPIFNNGRAARTRAEARWLGAKALVNALEAESSSRLRAARTVVGEARARVEYYRDVVLPRRARIVELTKLEHNAMLVGVFQLLQARQNLARAESEFIDAQREYWSARTNLDRALQGVADDSSFMPATDQGQGKRATISRGGH
ncbi:MAG TPA: TolC family protein [Thermoanaerobaculia bacterium]|nr:TolC family protein [Thermoanaerobaculia bacterium]